MQDMVRDWFMFGNTVGVTSVDVRQEISDNGPSIQMIDDLKRYADEISNARWDTYEEDIRRILHKIFRDFAVNRR